MSRKELPFLCDVPKKSTSPNGSTGATLPNKFKSWAQHSSGALVTEGEKEATALEIAQKLCNHQLWKAHWHGITRETAREVLTLKITDTEAVPGLDRAVRRMWALLYWIFESTPVYKAYISNDYCVFKNDQSLMSFAGGR